jgi:uncharacterized OsmC-like protein
MATITTSYKGDMLFETEIGKHKILVDVPEAMGGKDRGPMPPQFFVASLGSCVAALVADYCNRVGLDADGMTVDVSFEKVADPTRLVDLKVTINLPNADISGREKALRRVAEHCPVHETICCMSADQVEMEISGKA